MPTPVLPAKQYLFGDEARDTLFKGIDLMRKCVTATLGPLGRNVVIDRYMVVDLTKDGVTVLADVTAEDPFEEMGCKMVREASTKTNDDAGDGTTTAIELAWAMCDEGRKRVKDGTNVIKVQNGMEVAMNMVVDKLKSMAIKMDNNEEKYLHVATISAQDKDIGAKIAEIFLKSGENGVIDIERVDKPGIETEHTDGMQIMEGWMRPEFINDFSNLTFGIEDCAVIVTDREVTSNQELKFLEILGKKGIKKVVMVCDDCNGEALATFVKCARVGAFKCCVIKAPGYDERKREILKDIAAMTGATVISEENGLNLDEIDEHHIGHARQITCRQRKSTIVAKKDHKAFNTFTGESKTVETLIDERVKQLNAEIEKMDEGYGKEKAKERLASLTDGVSIIKLGANTEIERILMKRRVEDAIRAVQCAKEEGIVAGGGAALLKCVASLETLKMEDPDEQAGVDIVKIAIQSPARRILDVAGVEPEPAPINYKISAASRKDWTKKCQEKIVDEVRKLPDTHGYLMSKKGYEYGDLIIAGVVDPVKVVRCAFLNAASCAKGYLSSEVAITPIPDKDPTLNKK